jgi:hypothetical protein
MDLPLADWRALNRGIDAARAIRAGRVRKADRYRGATPCGS